MRLLWRVGMCLALVAVATTATAHESDEHAPGALVLSCDYEIKIDRELRNGNKESATIPKKGAEFIIDVAGQHVHRAGNEYPATFEGDAVRFTIGNLRYVIDRKTLRIAADGRDDIPAGTSDVSVEGLCKTNEAAP
jgi:hypothetical protein